MGAQSILSLLLSLSSSLCSLLCYFGWFVSGFAGFGPIIERILSPSYLHLRWQSDVFDFGLDPTPDHHLDIIPDFAYSQDPQALLRSDVILISHWWIAILISLHGKVFLFNLQGTGWLTLNFIFQVAYVWFGKLPR